MEVMSVATIRGMIKIRVRGIVSCRVRCSEAGLVAAGVVLILL